MTYVTRFRFVDRDEFYHISTNVIVADPEIKITNVTQANQWVNLTLSITSKSQWVVTRECWEIPKDFDVHVIEAGAEYQMDVGYKLSSDYFEYCEDGRPSERGGAFEMVEYIKSHRWN